MRQLVCFAVQRVICVVDSDGLPAGRRQRHGEVHVRRAAVSFRLRDAVDRDIAPNILLAAAGLLTGTGPGKGPVFTVSNGGSFFIYWPEGQDLRPEIDAALKPLRERGLVWSIFDREALKELGADPEAQMALEAPEGSFFSSRSSGELVVNVTHQGTHGFLPFRQGLEASFIAWGPGIKRGANLHRIRMTSIAPTILRDLGIDDPKFGDEAPLVEIFR